MELERLDRAIADGEEAIVLITKHFLRRVGPYHEALADRHEALAALYRQRAAITARAVTA